MFNIFSRVAKAVSSVKHPYTSAIILCAGASTRFGSKKQLAKVCGKSVAERTIEVFEKSELIKEIVLVVPKDDVDSYKDIVALNNFKKIIFVIGGETRQSSALRGLKHVSEKAKFIAIHDGARCLITEEILTAVLKEAVSYRCATAATKMTDTIKLSDDDGFIKSTLDREYLWSVQTPQIFDADVYKIASYNAKQNNIVATDDCMLVESAGFKVKLVETGKQNIKITHPEDIILAEQILELRRSEEQCE